MGRILRFLGTPLMILALIFITGLTNTTPTFAQAREPIVAGVDKLELSTDDTVILTVVVDVASRNVPQPELPGLDGFSIAGTSTSTQLSMINGVISNNVVYNYRLQPYRTGTLTIEPIKLTLNGQTYFTNPIDIVVTQGTGQTQPPGRSQQDFKAPSSLGNNDLFVEALVDNPEPYVGEQTNYIFRYYEALDSVRLPSIFGGQPDYQPPALTGFWAEGDIDVTSYRVSANGRIYNVTELTQVLFPTAAGEQIIDPARITITGNGLSNDAVLDTEPVVVDVRPAPEGAPASFTGAVGQFDIRAELDRAQTQVDEPVTMKITVEGQGNISTASDPAWTEIDGWRIFDDASTLNTQVEDGRVRGSHTYERLMVPTVAGQFTVPPVEYTYFDPVSDQYTTVATDPMVINVAPGIGAPGPIMAAGAVVNSTDSPTALTADDIDPMIVASLRPVPATLETINAPLTARTWYWLLWGVPLAALAGGFVWQRRQSHLERNAAAVRSSRARKKAHKAIAKGRKRRAQGQGLGPDEFVAAGNILTEYLSDKVQKPIAGMTNDAIYEELSRHGASDELIYRSLGCLDNHEHNLYSPAGVAVATPAQLLDEAEALVDELDVVLK